MDGSFIAFLGIAVVVIVTPGQDTALTIRNTLLGGRGAGIWTAIGVGLGQSTWTLAASLGLTAVLVASEPIFLAIRLFGAAYLIYLGARSILAALRPSDTQAPSIDAAGGSLALTVACRQGLVSSLSNPKLAIFFSSLLPQFVPPGASPFLAMVGLGAVFVAMTVCWLTLYSFVVARAGAVIRRGRIRRGFDAVMGTILVAFGMRLATASR
jgi:threonine/homoserine/homoserine lactone efflux protein